MMETTISRDVLVLGAGPAGIDAAQALAESGCNPLVIARGEVDAPESVKVLSNAVLSEFAGVAGDFRASITRNSETVQQTFGAVVVAPEYVPQPLNDKYNIGLSDRVITQTTLEEMLGTSRGRQELAGKNGSTIAFVTGFGQEGSPDATRRVLESALAVQALEKCSAYIYAGNVKVAGQGLERLFTKGRHNGVVCIKPGEMPEITHQDNVLKIVAKDPVLRDAVELAPDFIVVEEAVKPGLSELDQADLLRIDTDLEGFLPSNNVHRFPAKSNREGIFVANTAAEAANAVLGVKAFIGSGVKLVAEEKATVDENRCVICLTCYRCCPHGAIFWENGAAVISPIACQGCGICASECPMDAIQIGEFKDDDLKKEVKEAVGAATEGPSIVAFCCRNSALEAGLAGSAFGMPFPGGFRMVEVPCAGKVEVEFIMNALVQGADGVMVAACHEGNCKAERGNIYAKWRVAEIRKRLEAMGLDPERVAFVTVASNMADDFQKKATRFAEKLT
ncbi:MAG: hydrogenase iron-sulfur subunit [Desulfobacteraceae bacterium]